MTSTSRAGSIILTGTATLFEAAFTVELRDSSGTALVTLPVTAEECCVESQFNATLTVPAGSLRPASTTSSRTA